MLSCKEQVYSNDYFDFIIPYGVAAEVPAAEGCVQRISEEFDIFFYPGAGLPPLSVENNTYTSIPKCYGLLDTTALEASGILRLQNQPVLSLKGNGVLVGFIDTGIDYTNPLFCYADGSTRILQLWDQSIQDGTPPEGILYGAEYSKKEIDAALMSENPYDIVPSKDENGHGTFLAGVTCGGADVENDFIGAVPQAHLAVVKLKEAKQYLKDFYFIPDEAVAYQETDIMMGVAYLDALANKWNLPLVICLALGNSVGSHGKNGPLSTYLNYICTRRKRSVVTATGNEANTRHHFLGHITEDMEYEDVELNVEQDMDGFTMELWAKAPELYAVSVISPTGEQLPKIPLRTGSSGVFRFVFEGTEVSVDYRIEAKETASQLIYFRFVKPKRGLWTVRVYPESILTGQYNLWLPIRAFTGGKVYFLRSNPDMTLTSPGTARQVITVGGYQVSNRSIYADSGRGYTTDGEVKPDFAAPAVEVFGPGLKRNYVSMTGSSAAAAVAAGAVAQIMQWAIAEQNMPALSNEGIKNMLVRGARRSGDRSYPNREWGYGTLDVYHSLEILRK
jgi:subtilisin family serine protease